ncbi:hypothetical protein [Microbacterium sp. 1.5R]|uniref:hypothetical protein n=1 Tax=Microbacterium sp. 1.5R TaxID=1916917 RepID=UPI0011A230F7|nr:hypothetical protein [Microbacterium sp. 1.5R]
MLTDDESERRDLQAKAYGRAGGLTDAEAGRLRELESSLSANRSDLAAAEAEPAIEPPGRESVTLSSERRSAEPDARPRAGDASSPARDVQQRSALTGGTAPSADSSLAAAVRSHMRAVVAASAALLLVGVAAGWALFGAIDAEPALTAMQQERRLALQAEGEYDDDSVLLVAEDDDATVWYATRDSDSLACVILDVGDASQSECRSPDSFADMTLSVSIWGPGDGSDDPEGSYGRSISAVLSYATSGEPMAWIQRWVPSDSMLAQFEGAERDRAKELLESGYLPNALAVVGYFDGEPVWLAQRAADGTQASGMLRCMIVDAAAGAAVCQAGDTQAGEIRAVSLQPRGYGTPGAWTLHLRFTAWMNPYLTIEQGLPDDVDAVSIEREAGSDGPVLLEIPAADNR